jgi:hypothetical protein
MPILSVAFILMRESYLHHRQCGRRGPERKFLYASSPPVQQETISFGRLLRQRHSTRNFDDQRPITLEELSRFLEGTAPVLSESK